LFTVKKYGLRKARQRYKCAHCSYLFESKRRPKKNSSEVFWREYVFGKQTYKQLSEEYNIGIRTVQRRIDALIVKVKPIEPGQAVIIMDTCYFGREFGVMVLRDYYTRRNIYWRYVKHENMAEYLAAIETIRRQGWDIRAIVCDGKRGLFTAFGNIPVQMCQFHQTMIVTRYITKRPKIQASRELKEIVTLLTKTDKESFSGALLDWFHQWRDFLNEKTYAPASSGSKRKWHYTHHRLRSSYKSLSYNLPYLFTWYDNLQLTIPNTTNSLEAVFSDLKNKVRVHAGLKMNRKQKLINQILAK
jgi:hypothetical protein